MTEHNHLPLMALGHWIINSLMPEVGIYWCNRGLRKSIDLSVEAPTLPAPRGQTQSVRDSEWQTSYPYLDGYVKYIVQVSVEELSWTLLYTWRSYEAQNTWDQCIADGCRKRRMSRMWIRLKRGKKETSDLMTVLNMLSGTDFSSIWCCDSSWSLTSLPLGWHGQPLEKTLGNDQGGWAWQFEQSVLSVPCFWLSQPP